MMTAFELGATLGLDISEFKNGLDKARGMGESFEKTGAGVRGATQKMSSGFTILKGAISNVIGSGVNALAGAINNNLSGAISRVDTLNNYSTVMENLGHKSSDAKKAINQLSDGIDGLPTTLDSIASVQQQFTALGGSLEDNTKLTLALNNATLAGGQGQVKANSAMQQWYQMIAAGKSDLMSMRIINEAMPAQMDAIAKSVMGANANWQDLHEAWKENPEITDKVKAAILELNEKGGKGVKSFEQQAKDATQGIATSMQNVQTAITKGIANVFNEGIGQKTIAGFFTNIKDTINGFFTWATEFAANIRENGFGVAVGEELKNLSLAILDFFENLDIESSMNTVFAKIGEIWNQAGPYLLGVVANVLTNLPQAIYRFAMTLAEGMASGLPDAVNALMFMATSMVNGIVEGLNTAKDRMPEVIDNIIKGIGDAIVNFVEGLPDLLNGLADAFDAAGDMLLEGAMTLGDKIPELLGKIAKALWDNRKEILEAAGRLGLALIRFIIKGAVANATLPLKILGWLWETLWDNVDKLGKKVAKIGGNIVKGIWNGISDGYDWIKKKISGWVDNVVDWIKNKLGIKSPSKVMAREIGKWIPAGIAQGILGNSDLIEDAMDDVIPTDFDGITSNGIEVTTKPIGEGNKVFGDAGKVVNVYNNITVDGTENPEEFAERFARQLKMSVRTA